MENGQKKLKELFYGRKVFSIPDYQRAYAWDKTRQVFDEGVALGNNHSLYKLLVPGGQHFVGHAISFRLVDAPGC
jgi:hypothetical protein